MVLSYLMVSLGTLNSEIIPVQTRKLSHFIFQTITESSKVSTCFITLGVKFLFEDEVTAGFQKL